MSIVSEYSFVIYEFKNKSFSEGCKNAFNTAQDFSKAFTLTVDSISLPLDTHGLTRDQASSLMAAMQDKVNWVFKNVILTRSTVALKSGALKHDHVLTKLYKGPFTPEEFMKMMHYDSTMTNSEWLKFLDITVNSITEEKS